MLKTVITSTLQSASMQTIFRDVGTTSILFSKNSTITVSEEFIDCANEPITQYFENVTELPVSRHIFFAKVPDAGMQYNPGTVSFINLLLFVNHHYNPVTIAWKSLSERIYTPSDVAVPCSDLLFWLENLQPDLYWQQHYPGISLPFSLPQLSYQLLVNRLNIDCSLELYIKEKYYDQGEILQVKIASYLKLYNLNASKNKRKYTMLHKWNCHSEKGKIILEMDLGFAGLPFIRKFLLYLSVQKYFDKVEIW